jgi:hypothetical protein
LRLHMLTLEMGLMCIRNKRGKMVSVKHMRITIGRVGHRPLRAAENQ